jgi:hypothetical protein
MRRILLSTLLALAILQSGTLMAQTTLFKFNQDGEFAFVDQSIDQNTSIRVTVARNSATGTAPTASISFALLVFSPDFSTLTVTQIVGNIPGSAFTGQTAQHLTLNLDTSQLDPNASLNQTCTILVNDLGGLSCVPGPSGNIQLTFAANGFLRSRVLAFGAEFTNSIFTERIHQRSDSGSANFSGTVLGTTVSGSGATVGVNHNSSFEFVRN